MLCGCVPPAPKPPADPLPSPEKVTGGRKGSWGFVKRVSWAAFGLHLRGPGGGRTKLCFAAWGVPASVAMGTASGHQQQGGGFSKQKVGPGEDAAAVFRSY